MKTVLLTTALIIVCCLKDKALGGEDWIIRYKSDKDTFELSIKGNKTTHRVTGLEATRYSFSVQACSNNDCTPLSDLVSLNNQKAQHNEQVYSPSRPIVCYYTWNGEEDLTPEKIDPSLCSHIIVGFTSVSNLSVSMSEKMKDGIQRTVALKSKEPGLTVMFSIGGGANEHGFSDAVRTKESRKIFIESITNVIESLDLDGVDIDWEFPSWFSDLDEKENFVKFLKEFRYQADKMEKRVLLSVAVAAKIPIIRTSYDAIALAAYTDFINLMTYGFHDYNQLEDPFTGFNSPLYPRQVEKAYFATLNMDYAAEYWLKLGIPKSKLYVGLPVYAHSYKLLLEDDNGVDVPAESGGQDWSYFQCCDFLNSGATRIFNNESLVPYMYKNLTWISYDDEESLTYKAKWLKKGNYGGVMIFNMNTDDWQKKCGEIDFPLIKLIRSLV